MDAERNRHDHQCLRVLAQRMARACRHVIEDVLYEWEVKNVEQEFFELILEGLKEAVDGNGHRNQA
jgi:hypothetical protein